MDRLSFPKLQEPGVAGDAMLAAERAESAEPDSIFRDWRFWIAEAGDSILEVGGTC